MLLKSFKVTIQHLAYHIVNSKMVRVVIGILFLVGCSSIPYKSLRKETLKTFSSAKYAQQHTGFLVVDLESKDTLINLNASKYFIPASTTKLFSFYTSLQLLEEQLPSLKYVNENNSLIAVATGDPTWLHPYFRNEEPIQFLREQDSVLLFLDNFSGEKLGPGWAWEDYGYEFSTERSALPLFANTITLEGGDSLKTYPRYFSRHVEKQNGRPGRAWKSNDFFVPEAFQDTLNVPFITSSELTLRLLSEYTGKNIRPLDSFPRKKWNILKGISRDSVIKQMLWESDNFLAEQLMLSCSSTLSDTLSFEKTRDYILKNQFNSLKQKPRWVDGSGLSRYNLFTPNSMVRVLQKLYTETDTLQLFALMPHWDLNGTIPQKEIKQPSFIRAKSGSMGNVYNLCGYLKTSSGKLLAFSFMNNHFQRPSSAVRKDMFDILTALYNSY